MNSFLCSKQYSLRSKKKLNYFDLAIKCKNLSCNRKILFFKHADIQFLFLLACNACVHASLGKITVKALPKYVPLTQYIALFWSKIFEFQVLKYLSLRFNGSLKNNLLVGIWTLLKINS